MSCLQLKNPLVKTLLGAMADIKVPDASSSVEDDANDETTLVWN